MPDTPVTGFTTDLLGARAFWVLEPEHPVVVIRAVWHCEIVYCLVESLETGNLYEVPYSELSFHPDCVHLSEEPADA